MAIPMSCTGNSKVLTQTTILAFIEFVYASSPFCGVHNKCLESVYFAVGLCLHDSLTLCCRARLRITRWLSARLSTSTLLMWSPIPGRHSGNTDLDCQLHLPDRGILVAILARPPRTLVVRQGDGGQPDWNSLDRVGVFRRNNHHEGKGGARVVTGPTKACLRLKF